MNDAVIRRVELVSFAGSTIDDAAPSLAMIAVLRLERAFDAGDVASTLLPSIDPRAERVAVKIVVFGRR